MEGGPPERQGSPLASRGHSAHTNLHGHLPAVAGVGGEHLGGAHPGGRGSQGRAQLGGGTLAVPSAPCAVVFFCCVPNLFRIGEAAETSRDRPVGAEQGDDARIADQVQTIACWQT